MILATEQAFVQPKIQGIVGPERNYHLLDDYRFEWVENGKRYARTVYMMDETDLASVPDPAAALGFEQAGPSDGGAVLHDDDYRRLGRKDGNGFLPGQFQVLEDGVWVDCKEPYTRLRADRLYRRRCIAGGMQVWKANIEFAALRVGAYNPKNTLRWYFS